MSIVGSLRDREVACSAADRQGSNFESCVRRTVSSQSSHHSQKVLLVQFSLYVHKGGLKPDSFHYHGCLLWKTVLIRPHSDWWILVCFTFTMKERSSQNGARTRDLRLSKQAVLIAPGPTPCEFTIIRSGARPHSRVRSHSSKHDTLTQCWTNVGPASQTVAQHWPIIGSMSRVFWDMSHVIFR